VPLIRPTRRPAPARSAFAGFRFPPEVIVLAVRWYLRFGLSGSVALTDEVSLGQDPIACS
jgi:hypothetical protein